jgi:hypothetical protein
MMGDASDGKGPFITYWGAELGPWPTVADGFKESQLRKSPASLEDNPLPEWGTGFGIHPDANGVLVITVLDKHSRNEGTEEVTLNDAYLISGITGSKRPMKVHTGANEFVPIGEIEPIPPGATISLRADFNEIGGGISETDFMKEWATTYFVYQYNGKKPQRITMDEKLFRATFDSSRPKPITEPRVTKRKPS